MKPADNFDPGKWLIENKLTNQSKLNEMPVIANPKPIPEDIKEYFLELIQIYSDGNDNEYNEGQEREVSFEGINFDDWDMDIEDREGFKNARNYLKKNGSTIFKNKINYTFSADGEDLIMKWTEPDWEQLNEMPVIMDPTEILKSTIQDWWAKANNEFGLDFEDDIYDYIDSDESWQRKFANEVINIKTKNYKDFKIKVKKIYKKLNPF